MFDPSCGLLNRRPPVITALGAGRGGGDYRLLRPEGHPPRSCSHPLWSWSPVLCLKVVPAFQLFQGALRTDRRSGADYFHSIAATGVAAADGVLLSWWCFCDIRRRPYGRMMARSLARPSQCLVLHSLTCRAYRLGCDGSLTMEKGCLGRVETRTKGTAASII